MGLLFVGAVLLIDGAMLLGSSALQLTDRYSAVGTLLAVVLAVAWPVVYGALWVWMRRAPRSSVRCVLRCQPAAIASRNSCGMLCAMTSYPAVLGCRLSSAS